MRVQFRRLTEADLPKILRMNQDFRQGFADPEAAQRFLQNPANWFFAALWEETVIGFTYGYALPRLNGSKNMLYLHEVGVAQRYQRQGIGMQMMCALQNICVKSNIGKIFLFTDSHNAPANAFYRKLGGEVSSSSGGKDTAYFFPIQMNEIQ